MTLKHNITFSTYLHELTSTKRIHIVHRLVSQQWNLPIKITRFLYILYMALTIVLSGHSLYVGLYHNHQLWASNDCTSSSLWFPSLLGWISCNMHHILKYWRVNARVCGHAFSWYIYVQVRWMEERALSRSGNCCSANHVTPFGSCDLNYRQSVVEFVECVLTNGFM